MFGQIFQTVFYQPVLNLLVFLYNQVGDLGIAIILLTILIKVILWPLSQKSIKSQADMQMLQPKLNELKKKYKDDKTALGQATMDLYKEYKINPMSSCLPLLIQLPFLYGVFRALRVGLTQDLSLVYPFITPPTDLSFMSFGVDLSQRVVALAVLAGLAQFVQSKMMMKKQPAANKNEGGIEEMSAIMNKQMVYLFPIMTIVFGLSLPGGLTLYWLMFTLLTAFQQLVVQKKKDPEGPIEGQVIS